MAKALIVEDQDDIMPAVEEALAGRGDTFDRASSLDEARAMFQADDYAYVLLDLKIPSRIGGAFPDKIYGIAVLREIRSTAGKELTPVIAMTSFHSDGFGISTELHALGVNECISKPFDENRPLMKVIEDVLQQVEATTEPERQSWPDPAQHTTAKAWTTKDGSLHLSTKTDGQRDGKVQFALREDGKPTYQMQFMRLLCHYDGAPVTLRSVMEQVYPGDFESAGADGEALLKILRKIRSLVSDIRNKKLLPAGINPDILPSLSIEATIESGLSLRLAKLHRMDDKALDESDQPQDG